MKIEILLFTAVVFSFTSAYLGKMLDDWMDKGSVLDWIRIRQAKKYDCNFEDTTLKFEVKSYFERQEAYRNYYWELAKKNKSFTPYLCVDCLSTRILLSLFTVFAAWHINYFALIYLDACIDGFELITELVKLVPMLIFSLAANRFFTGLKIS